MNFTALASIIRQVAAWGSLAATMWIGEHGSDGGFIKDIWAALKTASPPVAMFLFFWLLNERKERLEAQRQCYDRTSEFMSTMNKFANKIKGRRA